MPHLFALPCSSIPRARRSLRAVRSLRIVALALSAALFANGVAYAAQPLNTVQSAATMQQQLNKRGVGKSVKVVRRDGSEVKGNIVTIGADSVTIQAKKSPSPTAIAYSDVAAIKGPGMSTGAKIGIGVGIGVVVSAGILALVIKHELDKPWNF